MLQLKPAESFPWTLWWVWSQAHFPCPQLIWLRNHFFFFHLMIIYRFVQRWSTLTLNQCKDNFYSLSLLIPQLEFGIFSPSKLDESRIIFLRLLFRSTEKEMIDENGKDWALPGRPFLNKRENRKMKSNSHRFHLLKLSEILQRS